MTISLAHAENALDAAQIKAAELGVKMNIAVVDAGGHLTAFRRMDGAFLGSIDVAIKKANSSILFQMNSEAIFDFCKPGAQAPGLERSNGGLMPFGGGIPLFDDGGTMIGAIGVSGGAVVQDVEVAEAGRDALDAVLRAA